MAEFNAASMWIKLVCITISIAFVLELFGFAMGMGDGRAITVALLFTGFLLFIGAVLLGLLIVFLDEVAGLKLAVIGFVICAILGGLLTIGGVAAWGIDNNNHVGVYSGMTGCVGSIMAIIAGVFGIMHLVKQ